MYLRLLRSLSVQGADQRFTRMKNGMIATHSLSGTPLPPDLDAGKLHSLLGGCPRDIHAYILRGKTLVSWVESAAHNLSDVEAIRNFLRDPLGGDAFYDWADNLFLIRRSLESDVEAPHEAVLYPKGDIIFAPLMDQLARCEIDDLRRLHWAFSHAGPSCAAFSHLVFQAFAMRDLSLLWPTDSRIHFAPMALQRSDPLQFVYDPSTRRSSTRLSAAHGSPSSLPLVPRNPTRYDPNSLDAIPVDPECLYYPSDGHTARPLPDSFFFDCRPADADPGDWTHVDLCVLQTTVGAGAGDGLARALRDAVRQRCPRADFGVTYVLVVPCPRGAGAAVPRRVAWEMAPEFEVVPGDVFVQYLAI